MSTASHADKANKKLSDGKAKVSKDYREILERDDIKIVHIATPDHWHTKPLIEAMLAGKDVYCEKPLTLTIDEGKLIRKIQEETGAVVQVGTQQRSQFRQFTKAVAMAAEGRLGKIKKIQCAIGSAESSKSIPVIDVPKELDWDRWLGPAPCNAIFAATKKTSSMDEAENAAEQNVISTTSSVGGMSIREAS